MLVLFGFILLSSLANLALDIWLAIQFRKIK